MSKGPKTGVPENILKELKNNLNNFSNLINFTKIKWKMEKNLIQIMTQKLALTNNNYASNPLLNRTKEGQAETP